MGEKLAAQRICLDGHILYDGVRQASARSEAPVLCVARATSLLFVAVSGMRMVASWEYCLPARIDRPAVLVIPPMIVSHLHATPGLRHGPVELVLDGGQVALLMRDELGDYELRWRSDPRTFSAPPELGRLLVMPAKLVRLKYLDLTDAVHRAVLELIGIEDQHQIHRTRLAMMVSLSNGDLAVTGREIDPRAVGEHCFDPRLVIRALEMIKAEHVEVGLTSLGPRSASLSIVNREAARLVHCSLVSIGLDTQRLFPLPHEPGH